MGDTTNRKITLRARPEGYPKLSDFGLVKETAPQRREGEVLAEGVRRGISARPLLPALVGDVQNHAPI